VETLSLLCRVVNAFPTPSPAARVGGGIARPTPGEPPAPVPHPCSPCFIRSRSGIANSHNDNPAPAHGADAGIHIVRLWQLFGCQCRKSGLSAQPQQRHPRPSTGWTTGACHGYVRNHIRPLACGGPDAVFNLQWQTTPPAAARTRFSIFNGRRPPRRGPRIGGRRKAAATDLAQITQANFENPSISLN